MTLGEFLSMGGYAAYVWSAYGIWLVVMIVNVVQPAIKARGTIRRLSRALDAGGGKP